MYHVCNFQENRQMLTLKYRKNRENGVFDTFEHPEHPKMASKCKKTLGLTNVSCPDRLKLKKHIS
jgi:hypothetical protein